MCEPQQKQSGAVAKSRKKPSLKDENVALGMMVRSALDHEDVATAVTRCREARRANNAMEAQLAAMALASLLGSKTTSTGALVLGQQLMVAPKGRIVGTTLLQSAKAATQRASSATATIADDNGDVEDDDDDTEFLVPEEHREAYNKHWSAACSSVAAGTGTALSQFGAECVQHTHDPTQSRSSPPHAHALAHVGLFAVPQSLPHLVPVLQLSRGSGTTSFPWPRPGSIWKRRAWGQSRWTPSCKGHTPTCPERM